MLLGITMIILITTLTFTEYTIKFLISTVYNFYHY